MDFRFLIGRFLFAAFLFPGVAVRAEQADAAWRNEDNWRVCLAPSFLNPPISFPIPNATKTVFVPAFLSENEPTHFRKEQFEGLKVEWPKFLATSAENAAAGLEALKPEYMRNRKKIIESGVIRSAVPGISCMLLSPKFRVKFEKVFGPRFLVIVPNEFSLYLFPRLESKYRDYSPIILKAYRDTAHPVSLEVFEVSADGLRAVGIFGQP